MNDQKNFQIKITVTKKEKENFQKEAEEMELSESEYGRLLITLGEFDLKEEFDDIPIDERRRELRSKTWVFLRLMAGKQNPSYHFLEEMHKKLK